MTQSRIAVVTGATQGLGLALAEGLAARMDPADLVLLTGRDPDRVAAATDRLGATRARVAGRMLDVTDDGAVEALATDLAAELGGVDIVFSNAAARMTPERPPADQIDLVVETNNRGASRMLRAFGPVLRPGGRLLVVASSFGTLGSLDPRLHPLFDDLRSLADVDRVLAGWQAAVHDGTAERLGWPGTLNSPSKVLQVAAVRAVAAARREADLRDGTLVAALCPGLIDTDASRPWFADMSQAQTPAEAAIALVDLALADTVDPAYYGELVRFGQVLPWGAAVAPEAAAGTPATRIG
jgi:NAD(P)-dependent dehydrogenase (short-subunit alcohol dehydrogenase family)